MQNQSLLIHKTNLYQIEQQQTAVPDIQDGEVLFKVEKYALTTNNITYAVSGFKLKYWDFFPAEDPWGIVPVWGFGEVVASKHPEVAVGERCYGYFPMSGYLCIQPSKINAFGFSDMKSHRQGLAPIYNYYSKVAADPSFKPEIEDYMPIIKPLFVTSFLIYHFLAEETFFKAEQIVLTSASSKTALALAFMLHKNRATDQKAIVGLTSKRNIEFVKSTGYYDQVMAYEDYPTDLAATSTVIVDFAGKTDMLAAIGTHLGDHLKHIALIGITDWKSMRGFKGLPKAEFFFAPTHAQQKYKSWGVEKTNLLLNTDMVQFIGDSQQMIDITPVESLDRLGALYLEMLDGKVDPKKGYIVQIP